MIYGAFNPKREKQKKGKEKRIKERERKGQ